MGDEMGDEIRPEIRPESRRAAHEEGGEQAYRRFSCQINLPLNLLVTPYALECGLALCVYSEAGGANRNREAT